MAFVVFLSKGATFKVFLQRDDAIVVVFDVAFEHGFDFFSGVFSLECSVSVLQRLGAVTVLAVAVWVEFAVASRLQKMAKAFGIKKSINPLVNVQCPDAI